MKVVVADDEAPARRMLIRLLQTLGAEVVAEAETGLATLEAVGRTRPDLILLDIHMPETDGLALAARYAHLPPIVFVTADDAHALTAFDVGAVDYLLKPVTLERLAAALHRVEGRRGPSPFPTAAPLPPRVVIHTRGVIRFFDVATIDRFRAADKYTAFTVDGQEHLTEEPLTALEERLVPHGFVRVHRGELVRVAAIRALTHDDDGHRVHLADGQVVPVSRRLVTALRTALALPP